MRPHKSVLTLIAVCILMMFAAPAFAAVIYVDADAASGADSGKSWTDAYTDLQDALSAAVSGDEIWVASGTYKPVTVTMPSTADRKVSFVMKARVKIYGGFTGTEITRNQRDWENNMTILSGNIGDPSINTDNSYHVVTISGKTITNTAALDGFIISDGNAAGTTPDNCGGGMRNDKNSKPTVANCIFSGNTATGSGSFGGGMFNINSILKNGNSNSIIIQNTGLYPV